MKTLFRNLAAGALAFLTLIALPACEQKTGDQPAAKTEEELSAADLISNPNTANPQEVPVPNDLGVMTFTEREYDFGEIGQDKVVSHTFEFTNTGKKPIIIDNASASCGCTVPSYPKEPVAPGEKGRIDVQFNPHGRSGQQVKIITIRANTQPNISEVTIKANVRTP